MLKTSDKSHETEKKIQDAGPVKHYNENMNRPKPPSSIQPSYNQTSTFNLGNGLDAGNYDLNKLRFLPHVQCKESRYGNSVVPVLPSFFAEDK